MIPEPGKVVPGADDEHRGLLPDGVFGQRTLFQRLGLVRKTAKLIESGVLGTPVEQTYPLDDLHAALDHARRPGRAGKILLDLS